MLWEEHCLMKASIIWDKRWLRISITILFWLAIWQTVSILTPEILFAGPVPTVQSLLLMFLNMSFWKSIVYSLGKILLGFIGAFCAGCVVAIICKRYKFLQYMLDPMIQIMKSLPVACFIVVALIWVRASSISVLTVFFVVFPIIYINLMEGLSRIDQKMLEMAQLFRLNTLKRLRAVWLPSVLPYLLSACRVSVGMALKSGVAGEIIGLPRWSIGEQIYLSKLYLNTADLFAWSLVIIALSLAMEKLLVISIRHVQRKWGMTA